MIGSRTLGALLAIAIATSFIAAPAFAQSTDDVGETTTSSETQPIDDADTADEEAEQPEQGDLRFRNSMIVYPFAFLRRGFALAYERAFLGTGLSVLGRLSYDRQAGGDFRSNAIGLGLESRWYFLGRGPFTKYEGRAPIGPYFGLRFGWMGTRMREADGNRVIGTAYRYTAEGAFGLRMIIAKYVDLTPYLSVSFNTDDIGGLARILRVNAGFGVALGVLFDRTPQ